MSKRKTISRTRAVKAILNASREQLRKVTLAEKLAHPGKFSIGGAYLVPANIKKVTGQKKSSNGCLRSRKNTVRRLGFRTRLILSPFLLIMMLLKY
jgi:hypothetical protein